MGDDLDIERTEIRKELSQMSFEELMKLKEELGAKVYKEALFGSEPKAKTFERKRKNESDIEYKRANKNRPREMSSKRMVPFLGDEKCKKQKFENNIKDPRFDAKCGEYDSKKFKEDYSFINEVRENEIEELKKQLAQKTDLDDKKRIKLLIQKLENKNLEAKKWKIKQDLIKEEKQEIIKARAEGKQPHYQTKKERRTRELVKQFEELKSTGKLQKHLEKKRKKNASKDRKKFSFD